jgi:hypothetical protein
MMPNHESGFVKATKDFIKSVAKDSVYKIIDTLRDQSLVSEPISTYKVLSYVQVLEYAVDKKLKYPNIYSTLLKIDSSPNSVVVTQFFTDDSGEIILKGKGYLGRKVTVEELDEELKDILGSEQSVAIDLP